MSILTRTTPVLIIGLSVGILLSGCRTQSPQTSSQQLPQPPSTSSPSTSQPSTPSSSPSVPSAPSIPSLPGSPSSSTDNSSQNSQKSSQQKKQQESAQTAEETYGARTGSEQRKSEDIPDLDSTPSGGGANTQQEILEVLADIDSTLEQAASDPNASEEQKARIEQYQAVLDDLEASIGNDNLDPETLEALLDVISDLEESIADAAAEQSQDNRSKQANSDSNGEDLPVTITVQQVAILQDLIDIIGIPGATPGIGIPSIPSAVPPAGSARTGSEKLGDLDATLEASIGVFDGMILSERVSAQGKPGEFEGEGEIYTGGAEGLFEEGTLGEDSDGGLGGAQQAQAPEIPAGDQSASRNQSSGGGGGRGSDANQSAIPDDIPDGRDDDIVARQIREAASNETDPELREKLWEEYRRYKKGK